MEDNKVQEPVVGTTPVEPVAPAAPTAPVAVTTEDVAKMATQLKAEIAESHKGLQKVISRKDEEIKRLREQLNSVQTQPADFTTLLDIAEKKAKEDGNYEELTKIVSIRAAEANRTRQELELQMARQNELAESKRAEMEDKIVKAGLDPEDSRFDNVFLAWELSAAKDGRFDRAERILDKTLKTAAPKPASQPAPVDEAKLRERLEREIMEKHGLLKPDVVSPTGGSSLVFTKAQIAAMTPDEYAKNYDKIEEAYRNNRVK